MERRPAKGAVSRLRNVAIRGNGHGICMYEQCELLEDWWTVANDMGATVDRLVWVPRRSGHGVVTHVTARFHYVTDFVWVWDQDVQNRLRETQPHDGENELAFTGPVEWRTGMTRRYIVGGYLAARVPPGCLPKAFYKFRRPAFVARHSAYFFAADGYVVCRTVRPWISQKLTALVKRLATEYASYDAPPLEKSPEIASCGLPWPPPLQ